MFTLGWVIDRSFAPIARYDTSSHLFDVVEDTGLNLTSSVSFIETLARASLKTHLPGSPGIENEAGTSM